MKTLPPDPLTEMESQLRDVQDAIDVISDISSAIKGIEQIIVNAYTQNSCPYLEQLERGNLAALLTLVHQSLDAKISNALAVAAFPSTKGQA